MTDHFVPDKMHKVSVLCDSVFGNQAEVFLDGEPLMGVTDVQIRIRADHLNDVTITMTAKVDVDAGMGNFQMEKQMPAFVGMLHAAGGLT